jgi:alkaline phosphatase
MDEPMIADDGQPFTVLGYANGPGGLTELPRPKPDTGIHAIQQAAVPLSYPIIDGSIWPEETHSGEDVPLYATGPWSHLVGGVLEQNAIFHIVTHAFGWRAASAE